MTSVDRIPVIQLKGVGKTLADKLAGAGVSTIQDLLFRLPYRYEDRTRLVPIGSLRIGDRCLVEGVIDHSEVVRFGRRRLACSLSDGTGSLILLFFHFYPNQERMLSRGNRFRCFGEVREHQGRFQMVHPEFQLINEKGTEPVADRLTPIYPALQGIAQKSWRKLADQALEWIRRSPQALPELLSDEERPQAAITMTAALELIHRPTPDISLDMLLSGEHPAIKRLAYEELMAHHISLRLMRRRYHDERMAWTVSPHSEAVKKFYQKLPFSLTAAQGRVIKEIEADMRQEHAMLRLVQGDVGAGKTVVAAVAILNAIAQGFQAAFMAPTELLAEQHFQNISGWFEAMNIKIAWLSGSVRGKQREAALELIASGEAQLIIGTHALFQDDVVYKQLALVVIDEQHRFGVQQRLALKEKADLEQGRCPHQLIMTATPIPRTLAMVAYADLDSSVIDELPPGRQPVSTVVLPGTRREEVVRRVESICAKGQQVYWVCTLIDESDVLQCEAAEAVAQALTETLENQTIGLVHGRLKSAEKEKVMNRFKQAEIDVLVATTVIEVGVDVPNATLMIIENAERLGLAQLHQIRGRVGRGQEQSHCLLMYQPPLTQMAKSRLATMRETNDGFEIARKDLELRGPGEMLGVRQTGEMSFQIADLGRDQHLLDDIIGKAEMVMKKDPQRCEALVERWVGHREKFAEV